MMLFLSFLSVVSVVASQLVQMPRGGNNEFLDFSAVAATNATHLPIVVWHGLGDFCENPISMIPFVDFLKNITNSPVHCLEIGASWSEDAANGWIMSANNQVTYACNLLGKLAISGDFYGLGLSQGGLFMRALLQRCPAAKNMKRLVSIGGPQQGVESVPQCNGNTTVCQIVSELMDTFGVYSSIVQSNIAPANYWHDSVDRNTYLNGCKFLPDVNNALPTKSAVYKQRISSLDAFVMVEFSKDTVVFPRNSEWFGFFAPNSNTKRESLQQSELYIQDWLGLKTLDTQKKLVFYTCPTNHLGFSHQWFIDHLLQWIK